MYVSPQKIFSTDHNSRIQYQYDEKEKLNFMYFLNLKEIIKTKYYLIKQFIKIVIIVKYRKKKNYQRLK